jgi:cobalt-zinc-cadmium efflux system outer membrane protein
MRGILLISIAIQFLSIFSLQGQSIPTDTLYISRAGAETLFLQNNLHILAEKLSISQAEALVMQARLWPNPTLEVDEVNLWATPKQLSMGEELPGFGKNGFGRNQQVSLQLEQVLLTAGKRKKLVAIEEVSRDMATTYFADLLRNLKVELRNSLTELQHRQSYQEILARQLTQTQVLLAAYQRQVGSGNVSRSDIVRLKALQLGLRNQFSEIQKEIHALQKQLVSLMNLPPESYILLDNAHFLPETSRLAALSLSDLLAAAQTTRPDLASAKLEQQYYRRSYSYEKALRVPDLALKGGYDRGGNFLYNFIGFGIGIDLPIFNRNQGNIKYARIGIDRANLLHQQTSHQVDAEVVAAYRNLQSSLAFYQTIEADYGQELDQLLESFTQNFRSRNVGMLEYLNFFETYLDNKTTILNAQKEITNNLEELNYVIGTEINP